MNLVYITLDSLNRHLLPVYGPSWVETPNLERLAARGVVFDGHYSGSLPCMPARREMWTGTEEFWWRWWGPLEPWDRPLAYEFGRQGVTSQLITDHYHFFEWGAHSYEYDFAGYDAVRGHEHDNLRTRPVAEPPDWARVLLARRPGDAPIYLRNVQDYRGEEDFFSPRVFRRAAAWLREDRPTGRGACATQEECPDCPRIDGSPDRLASTRGEAGRQPATATRPMPGRKAQ